MIGNPPYVDSEEMTRSMPKKREAYTKNTHAQKATGIYLFFLSKKAWIY